MKLFLPNSPKIFVSLSVIGLSAVAANGQTTPTVFDAYPINNTAETTIVFDPTGTGQQLTCTWGLDTAWNHEDNMVRGMRSMTPDVVDIIRVSFNPYAKVTTAGVVPSGECTTQLTNRMKNVQMVESHRTGNKKVQIAINQDADVSKGQSAGYYTSSGPTAYAEWAKLLHAYVKTIESKYGNEVVSVAPHNEPDYGENKLSKYSFDEINKAIRNNHPDLQNVRISGGNTLNCDEALPWYEPLKAYLDEGNTHQLAGNFDNFVKFFQQVSADGKYVSEDELHNTMEAMVGVHYGVQTGIWWGTATRARGQFCQANKYGAELGYGENRYAWSAGSVYKSKENGNGAEKLQAFVGCSERQARPSSYSFVSSTIPVYVDGAGPTNEFYVDVTGDPNGGYMNSYTKNAEACYDMTNGEDVMPDIADGRAYKIMFKRTATSTPSARYVGGSSKLQLNSLSNGGQYVIKRAPIDNGGDNGFFMILEAGQEIKGWNLTSYELGKDESKLDNFTGLTNQDVRPDGKDGYAADNCLWYFRYAGDGWFRIINKHSEYAVRPAKSNGSVGQSAVLVQAPVDLEDDTQLFRFIPADELPTGTYKWTVADAVNPTDLQATATTASVTLTWKKSTNNTLLSYSLLRAGSDGKYYTIARNIKDNTIVDNTAAYGEEYKYKLVAFDKYGNRSKDSNVVEVSLPWVGGIFCNLPFNGDLADATGNSLHARGSATPNYVDGHNGKAIRPNAKETIILPAGGVPAVSRFSVCAWIKRTSSQGQYLFDFGSDESNHVCLVVNGDKLTAKACSERGEAELTGTAPAASTWAHVAVVFNGNSWKLYVNGSLTAQKEQPGIFETLPRGQKVLNYVGRGMRQYAYNDKLNVNMSSNDRKSWNSALDGIDDFHIYNFPLNADEVRRDMNGDTTPSGVEGIDADKSLEVVNREYFNLKGMLIAEPAQGEPVIVRSTFSDGSVKSTKEIY